jgi:methionyl-tRNA formyltransferase
MRAIVVGAVESTRVALRAVAAAADWRVEALVTLPPSLATRHSDFLDLRPDAEACGARVIHAADGNAPEVVAEIRDLDADHLFVVGWSQVCKPALLAAAGKGAIGFHPAPLPRLRGRAVIPWTILLDEKITGSTLFWLDEGVDSGPILAQRFFHLAPDETATTLYARHLQALGEVLAESLPRLAAGTAPRLPQDDRYATWCAKRGPGDGMIDWGQPSGTIERLIRAVTRPYPGAFTLDAAGRRLVVWAAESCPDGFSHAAMPGQVIDRAGGGFVVRCGDGHDLKITAFTDEFGQACPTPRLHARLGTTNTTAGTSS